MERREVVITYLVCEDRGEDAAFLRAVCAAAAEVQSFFFTQLHARGTFLLPSSFSTPSSSSSSLSSSSYPYASSSAACPVRVLHSCHPSTFFSAHANGTDPDDYFFNNVYDEMTRLDPHHFRRNSSDRVNVVYCDAVGNKGRACLSVVILPLDDLLGLVGRHPTQRSPSRWVAGLAHELGHAFGLSHPPSNNNNNNNNNTTTTTTNTNSIKNSNDNSDKDDNWVMGRGMYKGLEKCHLTEEDKRRLLLSPFFYTPQLTSPLLGRLSPRVVAFDYPEGVFERWEVFVDEKRENSVKEMLDNESVLSNEAISTNNINNNNNNVNNSNNKERTFIWYEKKKGVPVFFLFLETSSSTTTSTSSSSLQPAPALCYYLQAIGRDRISIRIQVDNNNNDNNNNNNNKAKCFISTDKGETWHILYNLQQVQ